MRSFPRSLSPEAGTTALVALALPALLLLAPADGTAQDEDLERCEGPVGTLAVVEPQDEVLRSLRRYQLESPTPVIRRMVQESGCFIVVERGVAFDRMQQERELARSGDLTTDANVGSGQMQAADFYLTPEVLFSEDNSGGVGGAIGGILGRRAGAIAGALKFKEAETSILITSTRTGIQIAAAQGKGNATDFRLGALSFLGGAVAGAGGYTNTNEGKVIMASFVDNYNNVVKSVREDPNLPRLSPEQVRALMTGAPQAGGGFQQGDIVYAKIDNVEIYDAPADGASIMTRVGPSDGLVYLGTEQGGFLQVQTPDGAGWIRAVLAAKQ